jgi:hypothetical protein
MNRKFKVGDVFFPKLVSVRIIEAAPISIDTDYPYCVEECFTDGKDISTKQYYRTSSYFDSNQKR